MPADAAAHLDGYWGEHSLTVRGEGRIGSQLHYLSAQRRTEFVA